MDRFFRSAIVAAAAISLAVGPGAGAVAQPAPYTIDVVMNLTGSNAFIGSVYSGSLKVLESYVNAHGGINGTPLKFNFLDDQTNPQVAVQLASQVIAKHPAVFFGGAQTATCAAIAPLVRNGPVDYCISPGFFPDSGGYAFASAQSLKYIMIANFRFARLSGYKRIAVLDPTDATGQSSDRTIAQVVTMPEFRDLQIVSQQQFNPTDISVAAQAQRIKDAHADVVFCFAGGPAFGTVLRGLGDAGVGLPVITSSANVNPAQLDQYKAFIPPGLYMNGLIYDERDALSRAARVPVDAFIDAFKGSGQTITPGTGIAWDPGWVVVSALRKLGTGATAQQLRDYLLNLHDFYGVMGTYDFRIGDQHGLTDNSVIQVKWNPDEHTFSVASRPGGTPIKGR